MHLKLMLACTAALCAASTTALAFDIVGVTNGTCPQDKKVQCAVKCADGQLADYMKWDGGGWSDLVGRIKDADMMHEAQKLVDHANHQMSLLGVKPTCK